MKRYLTEELGAPQPVVNKGTKLAKKYLKLNDPPKTVGFIPNNVSFEVLALIYLLRWFVHPLSDKSGNPYTKEPVVFALKVVAHAVGKPYEGYDYLEALDGLEDL